MKNRIVPIFFVSLMAVAARGYVLDQENNLPLFSVRGINADIPLALGQTFKPTMPLLGAVEFRGYGSDSFYNTLPDGAVITCKIWRTGANGLPSVLRGQATRTTPLAPGQSGEVWHRFEFNPPIDVSDGLGQNGSIAMTFHPPAATLPGDEEEIASICNADSGTLYPYGSMIEKWGGSGFYFQSNWRLNFRTYGNNDDVVVTDTGPTVILSNGIVSGAFNKPSGVMMSLRKGGSPELLRSGGFDLNWDGQFSGLNGNSYSLVESTPDHADISFLYDGAGTIPFVMDLHYVLRRGESGFYCYLVVQRPAFTASYLEQLRSVLWLKPDLFTYQAVSDDRQMLMPTPQALAAAGEVGEFWFLQDGSVYCKYDWIVNMRETFVHGLMGANYGVWLISASSEYINGGPTKQELSDHQTESGGGDGPVVLAMLHGGHYQTAESLMRFIEDETWQKFYGPFFIYVNSGSGTASLWTDAKSQAQTEQSRWPYPWLQHSLYPLDRGAVTGTLHITDGTSPEGAWVILSEPGRDWQFQSKGYLFCRQADADGRFTIPDVRPGNYTLSAYVRGVLDDFSYENVVVQTNQTTDLGLLPWTPIRHGPLLWQVGVPDRTCLEYRHGADPFGYGRWLAYPEEFPDDVDFIIGQSQEALDWNYLQPAVALPGGSFRTPSWNIIFTMDTVTVDEAALTIALAGVSDSISLRVYVNGTSIGEVWLWDDAAARLGGSQGVYKKDALLFDASLLTPGTNTITLTPLFRSTDSSIMYDCIRLETWVRSDLNKDGKVDLSDFIILGSDWLICTEPDVPGCVDLSQ